MSPVLALAGPVDLCATEFELAGLVHGVLLCTTFVCDPGIGTLKATPMTC